jgi:hypothetical protein
MSSNKNGKRVVSSWKFPEGHLMKAVATRLYDQELRGSALLEAFEEIFPNWQSYFEKPISRGAIVHRADKARRYANENPEKHPLIRPYWPVAGRIARKGERLSKKAVRDIVRAVDKD